MIIERPSASEYAPFYAGYVSTITEPDVLELLAGQPAELRALLADVSSQGERYRYADGKWSVRQVVGHMTDAERAFGYRAFAVSRGDTTPLPGFDENEYVTHSPYDEQPLGDLIDEFAVVREGNLVMLRRVDDRGWRLEGTANDTPISLRALAYVMAGHARHHLVMLRERYGLGSAPR